MHSLYAARVKPKLPPRAFDKVHAIIGSRQAGVTT